MTRSSLSGVTLMGAAAVALAACASRRLPPGTPPPEYETRTYPAWPPASAASNAAAAPVEPTAPPGPETPPGTVERGDAGTVPAAGPSPAAPSE